MKQIKTNNTLFKRTRFLRENWGVNPPHFLRTRGWGRLQFNRSGEAADEAACASSYSVLHPPFWCNGRFPCSFKKGRRVYYLFFFVVFFSKNRSKRPSRTTGGGNPFIFLCNFPKNNANKLRKWKKTGNLGGYPPFSPYTAEGDYLF